MVHEDIGHDFLQYIPVNGHEKSGLLGHRKNRQAKDGRQFGVVYCIFIHNFNKMYTIYTKIMNNYAINIQCVYIMKRNILCIALHKYSPKLYLPSFQYTTLYTIPNLSIEPEKAYTLPDRIL